MPFTHNDGESCKPASSESRIPTRMPENIEQQTRYFTLTIYGKCIFKIYKPLICMKLILFLWFMSASSGIMFLSVFFKQRGITVEEISVMYTITPLSQVLFTLGLGILSDKIGRSKPILIFNLMLSIMATLVLLCMPDARQNTIPITDFHTEIILQNKSLPVSCKINNNTIFIDSCHWSCSNTSTLCKGPVTFDCEMKDARNDTFFLTPIDIYREVEADAVVISADETYSSTYCLEFTGKSCIMKCTKYENLYHSTIFNHRNYIVFGYLLVQLTFIFTYGSTFRFIDITTMTLMKEHNSDYGDHRFWGILGGSCGPLLSTLVMKLTASSNEDKNYKASFYAYIFLNFLIAVLAYKMNIQPLDPGKKMWKKALSLLRNPDFFFFCLVVLVSGIAWGFNAIFKTWYLDDLGATSTMIGLEEALKNGFGLIFVFTSKWFNKKFGYFNIFIAALAARFVHALGFSFLKAIWPIFLLSFTDIFSYHLFWVAVVNYSYEIAPKGLVSSVNALAGVLQYTIGRLIGTVIGGVIMSNYGGRTAYRVMSAICMSMCVIYIAYLTIRRRCHK